MYQFLAVKFEFLFDSVRTQDFFHTWQRPANHRKVCTIPLWRMAATYCYN